MLFMGKATISTGPWLCDKLPEGTNKYGDSMAGLHDLHTLTLTWIHLDDCFVNRKLTHALSHQKHRETSVQKWLGRSNSIPSLVVSTPLKNLSSSVGVTIPSIWKKKKCSKPPSSSCSNLLFPVFDCSFGDQPVKSA